MDRRGRATAAEILAAVRQFVEKPDARRAAAYLSTGEFRWNAGMFVVRAATLLDLLHRWHPALADGVRAIAAAPERLDEIWPTLEKIAIDHAVAEPASDIGVVAVVPGDFAWDGVPAGAYRVIARRNGEDLWSAEVAPSVDGRLSFSIPVAGIAPLGVEIRRVATAEATR